jgi:uncharacterized protein
MSLGTLMIHRIEIENCGSIREAVTLDLALPRTTPAMGRFVAAHGAPDVRLPTVVAFFGPNASGKTTVLRALASTIDFAAHSFSLAPEAPIPYFQPFRSAEWINRPTRLTVEFDAQWGGEISHVYRYQLAVAHGNRAGDCVTMENLLIREGKRFRALFRRDEHGIRCAAELDVPLSDSRLKAIRANASVISTLAQFNHPLFGEVLEDIAATQRNFRGYQQAPWDMEVALRVLHEQDEALAALRAQLPRLDLGLLDMNITESARGLVASFTHEGLDRPILLDEESNGTRRFLAMFPYLWFTVWTGRPALIDEFDVDLHPLLVPEILKWFQDPEINPHRAQLFLTAHNPAIMDYLEKEEVYLVEKSNDGASSIIPLRDVVGLRREPSLQRKYLGGVFGAVPNIG